MIGEEILNEAKELESEIIKNRRAIHSFAEIGFELDKTVDYVMTELKSYGIQPKIIGRAGITFNIGSGAPTIMLRADMDALPMEETTGLDYAATNGNCHACGHDIHTSMLLAAAKILKGREDELKGTVKFMFQPAEEQLAGAKAMVEDGLLENPKVDVALAMHISTGTEYSQSGTVLHAPKEITMSGDAITIKVIGKDAHGSTPHLGVDAIYIAANIVNALKALNANSVPSKIPSVVLVGKINGGTAPNTVAGQVTMEVSVRSRTMEYRDVLFNRIEEVSKGIAQSLGGSVEFIHDYGMALLYNDEELDGDVARYNGELLGAENVKLLEEFNGSEDFSLISQLVPSTFINLGVGSISEGYPYYMHHPSLKVDETVFYKGAAIYAHTAIRWLEEHSK